MLWIKEGKMLFEHFKASENHLLALSMIPANSGHTLHMGTPRENFIQEFLQKHLSQRVGIGTGEIIDANSKPGENRNQIDIVIYDIGYPRIHFGGEIYGFLAESVIATIEVKSTLTEEELAKSIKTANKIKSLTRNTVQSFVAGHQPPGILNFVVGYSGPAKLETTHGWISRAHTNNGFVYPKWGPKIEERAKYPSPSLDGVYQLGKGFIYFDNSPMGFLYQEERDKHPDTKWILVEKAEGSLLFLFLQLLQAVSNIAGRWLNPIPYLSNFKIQELVVKDG